MSRPLLDKFDESERPLTPLQQKVGSGLILVVVCIGFGCIYTAGNPEIITIDDGNVSWKQTTCQVLSAGMDYVGSCGDSRADVNDGNYSRCSPYVFCANEGENQTCECSGTARFGTRGLDPLESRTVESEVSGSIGCNVHTSGFNHTDPAPFFGKQCWCRPERLSSINPQDVTPHACAEASSLAGWVPDKGANGTCVDAYLSWALVTVAGEGSEPSVTRCAYEYGSPPMSWTHNGSQAKQFLDDAMAGNIGQSVQCSVLNNPPGGVELGALEDCVVGFSPDTNKTVKWAQRWQAQVRFRYEMCWTALGFGFFIVAPALAYRLKLIGQD